MGTVNYSNSKLGQHLEYLYNLHHKLPLTWHDTSYYESDSKLLLKYE